MYTRREIDRYLDRSSFETIKHTFGTPHGKHKPTSAGVPTSLLCSIALETNFERTMKKEEIYGAGKTDVR